MRWPVAPLFAAAARLDGRPIHPAGQRAQCALCPDGCFSRPRFAEATGFSHRSINRWLEVGELSDQTADAAACALGLHPALIWPGWTEAGMP